jgi:hypothetical protein
LRLGFFSGLRLWLLFIRQNIRPSTPALLKTLTWSVSGFSLITARDLNRTQTELRVPGLGPDQALLRIDRGAALEQEKGGFILKNGDSKLDCQCENSLCGCGRGWGRVGGLGLSSCRNGRAPEGIESAKNEDRFFCKMLNT